MAGTVLYSFILFIHYHMYYRYNTICTVYTRQLAYPAHILSTSVDNFGPIYDGPYFFLEFYRIYQNKIKWRDISWNLFKSVPFSLTLRGRGYSGPLHLTYNLNKCIFVFSFSYILSTTYPHNIGLCGQDIAQPCCQIEDCC